MIEKKPELSIEEALDQYYRAPEPRPAFLSGLEQRLAHVPAAQVFPQRRLRLAYAGLALVLALAVSTAAIGPGRVLAAIRGLVGYIPGFGLVQDNTFLRVLAVPISVTHDGVTLTVTQAVLSPERTSISFTVQNIPPAALPEWIVTDRDRICTPLPELRLPDGSSVAVNGYGAGYVDNVYQRNYFFPALPANVKQATFMLACLPETLAGKAPEKWEIPLKFNPAPLELTQLPVVELTPAAAEQAYPLSLDRVVETEDGFIFSGSIAPGVSRLVSSYVPEITDANGHRLGIIDPGDIGASPAQSTGWAYQIHGKEQAWPITIRYKSLAFVCENEAGFTLNTGSNPKAGQKWAIDRDFYSGDCSFHLNSVERLADGYRFDITAKNTDVNPIIDAGHLTAFESQIVPGGLWVSLVYNEAVPEGKLPIQFSVYAARGPWEVQWQPEK